METTTATVSHITDAEGFGTCAACGREGLRWLVHFNQSDQLPVGLECAKAVLGFKPAPKSYNWMDGYTATRTVVECEGHPRQATWVLYTHTSGRTASTRNGVLQVVGGAAQSYPFAG
jgi:hypothetical protein